jgi:hypothetical protein
MDQIELQKKIDQFNKEINQIFDEGQKRIFNNIENAKNKFNEIINEKKIINNLLTGKRQKPILQKLDNEPNQTYNSILNPILLLLANLKIITLFALGQEKDAIIIKMKNLLLTVTPNNIVLYYFMKLMNEMRNTDVAFPNSKVFHQYLIDFLKSEKKEYLCQDPGKIINTILIMIDSQINLIKNIPSIHKKINEYDEESVRKYFEERTNNNPTFVTTNFSMTLITKKKCAQNHTKYSYNQIFAIDLFPKRPEVEEIVPENLKQVFYFYINDEPKQKEYCQKCKTELQINKNIESLKDYLIININRKEDPENKMKIIYPQLLDISTEKKELKYELISVLMNINTITANLDREGLKYINRKNKNNYVLFTKNFINKKWYKTTENEQNIEFKGKLDNEINKFEDNRPNPLINLLVYKKS